ncbi:hypothetical protein GCM10011316_04250 [Roseibium aquae]|uniref:DUF1402 family protein n=2 Tax=Roseibium aquae TaxID=1323746 RepID=A0A916T9Q1_9HYPH|nr:hypothetical protein GCM10011316_04250 [Roseibium aquae]
MAALAGILGLGFQPSLSGFFDPPAAHAAALRTVPEGNRYRTQPAIPFASARRTAASQATYDQKFERVLDVLRRDKRLMRSIKQISNRYSIDPIHMIGAIVGEHTYNFNSLDSAQSYYIKALAYAGIDISFSHGGEHVEEFVKRPQFEDCRTNSKTSNTLWSCYEKVWEKSFRNKTVDDRRFPNRNFNETFFQPLFAGQSFGFGQLSPLTVLKMTDRVASQSANRKLDAANAGEVYRAAMDPNISLHYMAAVIQDAIEAYKTVANVDISKNPGLTATLYNVGDPWDRAAAFRRSGRAWPRENYYGWLVNDRLEELKSLL